MSINSVSSVSHACKHLRLNLDEVLNVQVISVILYQKTLPGLPFWAAAILWLGQSLKKRKAPSSKKRKNPQKVLRNMFQGAVWTASEKVSPLSLPTHCSLQDAQTYTHHSTDLNALCRSKRVSHFQFHLGNIAMFKQSHWSINLGCNTLLDNDIPARVQASVILFFQPIPQPPSPSPDSIYMNSKLHKGKQKLIPKLKSQLFLVQSLRTKICNWITEHVCLNQTIN